MKIKKTPTRMCLGCQEMKAKKDLIRVVKNKENEIKIDLVGKAPGRGSYICKCTECFDKAFKAKKFERALGISISPEIYEQLMGEISHE
ncbi:MAG: YlxR family protein [Clostridium sp.]